MSETPSNPPFQDRPSGGSAPQGHTPSGGQPGLGPSGPQYTASPPHFAAPGSARPAGPPPPVAPAPGGYAQPGPGPGLAAGPPVPDGSSWAMVAHLVGVVFACTGWLPALIVYLVVKGRSPFARHHAAEALNLQLTLFVPYVIGAGVFVGFGVFVPDLVWIGSVLTVAVWLLALVFGTLAATAAARDVWYRYPIAVHLVR